MGKGVKLGCMVVAILLGVVFSIPAMASDIVVGFNAAVVGGHLGDYGGAALQGAQLAVREYNAKGGYKGTNMKLIIYDTEGKPPKAVENLTRLVTRDKVVAVIGPCSTGEALAVIDLHQKYEILFLTPVGTSDEIVRRHINDPKSYTFRVTLNDQYQVSLLLDYLQAKGFKKIVMINGTSGWGEMVREETLKQMKSRGMKLALPPERCGETDTDMTSQLEKFKQVGADFLLPLAYTPAVIQILKSLEKIQFKVPIGSTWTLIAPNYLHLGGKELIEGTITVSSFSPDADPKSMAFHEKIIKAYGQDMFPVCAAQGYDAANLVLQALDMAGPDRKKLRDALENIDNFEAVSKIPKKPFGPKDHEAYGPKDGYLVQWRNGVTEMLKY